ncbi:hypothetical protein [Actinoplanes sp. G11-F43]
MIVSRMIASRMIASRMIVSRALMRVGATWIRRPWPDGASRGR